MGLWGVKLRAGGVVTARTALLVEVSFGVMRVLRQCSLGLPCGKKKVFLAVVFTLVFADAF